MTHRLVAAATIMAATAVGCASNSEPNGTWELASAEIDQATIPELEGLFLTITGEEFAANGACNGFGGPFGGEISSNLAGCLDETLDRNAIDERMIEAITNGPDSAGDQLVFTAEGVRLIYTPFVVTPVEELFTNLENPELTADISELFFDPEGGPARFDYIVRLDHSSAAATFHLATQDSGICLHWSLDDTSGTWCQAPRSAATRSYAYGLTGPSGSLDIRVALIPDTLANQPELETVGVLENNILVLDPTTPSGEIVMQRPDGGKFTLTIP